MRNDTLPASRVSRFYWLFLFFLSILFTAGRVDFDPSLITKMIGTDSYLRFLTLEELVNSGHWYNHHIANTNWPYGLEHHWSRVVDLLLLPFLLLFKIWLPPKLAMLAAALSYSTCVLLTLLITLSITIRRFAANDDKALLSSFVVIAALCNPFLLAYFAPGRVDHHSLLSVLLMLSLFLTIKRQYFAAGMVSGIGIWVSVEFFIPFSFLCLAISLRWLKTIEPGNLSLTSLFGGTLPVTLIAILTERPPSEFFTPIADCLSVIHLLLLLLFWISAMILEKTRITHASFFVKTVSGILSAAFTLGITLYGYPQLMDVGFVPHTDTLVKAHFNQNVGEMQPPFATRYGLIPFIPLLLTFLPLWVRIKNQNFDRTGFVLLIIALGLNLFLLTAFRWAYYAQPVVIILFAYAIAGFSWQKRPFLRVGMLSLFIALPLALLIIQQEKNTTAQPSQGSCFSQIHKMIQENQFGELPQTVALPPDFGYELLFFTPHRILAANNHRNVEGLGDLLRVLQGNSRQKAAEIIQKRKISLILTCKPLNYKTDGLLESKKEGLIYLYRPLIAPL